MAKTMYTYCTYTAQVSYAIGLSDPLSIYVDTYGTGKKSNEELIQIIKKNFDLRPGVIIRYTKNM